MKDWCTGGVVAAFLGVFVYLYGLPVLAGLLKILLYAT